MRKMASNRHNLEIFNHLELIVSWVHHILQEVGVELQVSIWDLLILVVDVSRIKVDDAIDDQWTWYIYYAPRL